MRFNPGCCCDDTPCTCIYCDSDSAPCCLRVAFEDIERLAGGCWQCEELNRVYYLRYNPSICRWGADMCNGNDQSGQCFGNSGGPADGIYAELTEDSGDYILTVGMVSAPEFPAISIETLWQVNLGSTRPNCSTWGGLNVPYASASGNAIYRCDATGSTCTVSAQSGSCPSEPCQETCGCCQENDSWNDQYSVEIPTGFYAPGSDCESHNGGSFILTNPQDFPYCTWEYEHYYTLEIQWEDIDTCKYQLTVHESETIYSAYRTQPIDDCREQIELTFESGGIGSCGAVDSSKTIFVRNAEI